MFLVGINTYKSIVGDILNEQTKSLHEVGTPFLVSSTSLSKALGKEFLLIFLVQERKKNIPPKT